jgi:integrase
MKDTKHLQLRHNTWWLYYKLPKRLKSHPLFADAKPIQTQSLKTDSITTARRLRDRIINNLHSSIEEDNQHEAWEREILSRSLQFAKDNPHLGTQFTYEDLLVDRITSKPTISPTERIQLEVITKTKPDRAKSLQSLSKKVIDEGKARQLSPAALFKITRGVDWFCEHLLQDDIDISLIDWDQVHGFVVSDSNSGVSGSTLDGYLYGLRQVWERARQSKLVSGDNPFQKHRIKKDTVSYEPFTKEEVSALYRNATGELKVLIHAAATTGARFNELLTAEVKTPSTYDNPCWFFKFTSKGKTEQSTRVVPLHRSLCLPEGYQFTMVQNTLHKQFKKLMSTTLGEPISELTGKPRRLSFHSFRSTVITELTATHGVNEKIVGSISGHTAGASRVGSIRTYIQPNDLAMKKKVVDMITWLE